MKRKLEHHRRRAKRRTNGSNPGLCGQEFMKRQSDSSLEGQQRDAELQLLSFFHLQMLRNQAIRAGPLHRWCWLCSEPSPCRPASGESFMLRSQQKEPAARAAMQQQQVGPSPPFKGVNDSTATRSKQNYQLFLTNQIERCWETRRD